MSALNTFARALSAMSKTEKLSARLEDFCTLHKGEGDRPSSARAAEKLEYAFHLVSVCQHLEIAFDEMLDVRYPDEENLEFFEDYLYTNFSPEDQDDVREETLNSLAHFTKTVNQLHSDIETLLDEAEKLLPTQFGPHLVTSN